jgi:hypothetical protein
MIHGAPANATDRDRWSWILFYTPADARYGKLTGEPQPPGDEHPVVYPPAGE